MGGSVLDLLSAYPHLQKIAQFLILKTKSPVTSFEERKDAELSLKEFRILATKAARGQQQVA